MIAKQFKAFTKATSEYHKHPEKFRGKPQLPSYKKKYRSFYVGRNGYQIQNHQLIITGGEAIGFSPMTVLCCEHQKFNAKAQEVNISKRNNQNFVLLPHGKFVDMIRYKAEEYGIEVTTREKSYTSKASVMDIDVIADLEAKETKPKPVFSGKRIKRELYLAKEGLLINADINGAANIGRKELGDE